VRAEPTPFGSRQLADVADVQDVVPHSVSDTYAEVVASVTPKFVPVRVSEMVGLVVAPFAEPEYVMTGVS